MSLQNPLVERRAWFVPWLFPGGLALVFLVNMGLLWLALDTFPGTVTRNAYEEGRAYNKVLALEADRDKLGWRVDIVMPDPTATLVEIRYTDREGRPVPGLELRGWARRPVGDPVTIELELAAHGPGVFRATPAFPYRGLWEVRVQATGTAGIHQHTARVRVP